MRLAQLSDLHITLPGRLVAGRIETTGYLRRAIERINTFSPRIDAVVITGDLVDLGQREEYEALREVLRDLAVPVHLLLGNHDDRDAFHSVFGGDGFVQFTAELDGVQLIAIDTLDPGHPSGGGRLCEQRLAWLASELDRARGPVILAMHHPPFATGIGFMDSALLDREGNARFIEVAHDRVERIICGHIHRAITARVAGTVAMVAPSCAHQVTLALTADAPASFVYEPPAFVLHCWNGALVSHVVPIERADGPYLF